MVVLILLLPAVLSDGLLMDWLRLAVVNADWVWV